MDIKKLNTHGGKPMIIKKVSWARLQKQEDQSIDIFDFSNSAIYALIPVFERDGKYFSMETGNVVSVSENDQVVSIGIGTSLFFKDGSNIVYTRGWLDGVRRQFFAENKCKEATTSPIHVFGEGDAEPIE